MNAEDVKTEEDLLAYILEYQGAIYVRADIDGEQGNYSLAELPFKLRANWILTFLTDGRIPVRQEVDRP